MHEVSENDNMAMGIVMAAIEWICDETGVAAFVPAHLSKHASAGGSSSYVGNVNAGRGAAIIGDAGRIVTTLAAPTEDDLVDYGFRPWDRQHLLRIDDAKFNRGIKRGEPIWLRKHGVRLHTGDEIVAFTETDARRYAHDVKMDTASALYVEISARNTSSISLWDAAVLLRKQDPLWGQCNLTTVQAKVSQLLSDGVELGGSAGRITCRSDAKGKKIVLD